MDTTLIGGGFLILGLVVWIVCIYYAIQMAPKRGRGAATWGVLTFFFGPLALMRPRGPALQEGHLGPPPAVGSSPSAQSAEPPRSAAGRLKLKIEPRPTSEVSQMRPPCASTISLQIGSPRPVPRGVSDNVSPA